MICRQVFSLYFLKFHVSAFKIAICAKIKDVYKKNVSSNINEVIKTREVWVDGVVRSKRKNVKFEIL